MSITTETGNIEILLASWWSHSQWEVRHLARNFRLDCPGLTAPDHPNCESCGSRLNERAVSFLNERAQEMMDLLLSKEGEGRPWVLTWANFQRELNKVRTRARELFEDSPLTPPDVPAPRIEVIRYVDCRSFYYHWLGHLRADDDPKLVQERCRSIDPRPDSWSTPKGPPGKLTREDSMVWVTRGSPPPHRRRDLADLEDAERAKRVVRLLGLSGYDQPEERREKVGLMAVFYEIAEADLRAPMVVDALNNPYFFPGFHNEDHGRVASLNADFSSPWERAAENSTIPEWVHANGKIQEVRPRIELVGFFED